MGARTILPHVMFLIEHRRLVELAAQNRLPTVYPLRESCCALRHRAEDINMRSVWLCSRNDLTANVSVLVATWAVWATRSPWPDVGVGALIGGVFVRSVFLIARDARAELSS